MWDSGRGRLVSSLWTGAACAATKPLTSAHAACLTGEGLARRAPSVAYRWRTGGWNTRAAGGGGGRMAVSAPPMAPPVTRDKPGRPVDVPIWGGRREGADSTSEHWVRAPSACGAAGPTHADALSLSRASDGIPTWWPWRGDGRQASMHFISRADGSGGAGDVARRAGRGGKEERGRRAGGSGDAAAGGGRGHYRRAAHAPPRAATCHGHWRGLLLPPPTCLRAPV